MNTPAEGADLIISGRYLMPTYSQKDVIIDGAVAISGDTITKIGSRSDLRAGFPQVHEIHEPHGLIMPGLINTHTHAPMACIRGFADDLPLKTSLREHISHIESQLSCQIVYESALLSMVEMIKSGTTSFCDTYHFAKDVARAAEESGLRAWIGELMHDYPCPSHGECDNDFSYVEDMFTDYSDHPLVTITVAPHNAYTCSPELLMRCHHLAEKHDSLFVIHLAETNNEVTNCRTHYGTTPVRHLHDLSVLDHRTLAAHCVILDEEEVSLLADQDVRISHCIESNMKCAFGIAPIPLLLNHGINVSIGTDGSARNSDFDMFSEMNSVAKTHKGMSLDPTTMGAETTLDAATRGGAAALKAYDAIGSLACGKKADCIVLDLNQPHLMPLYNLPSQLVYAARGADVIHSVINGRIVMENRFVKTLDEDDIISRMHEINSEIIVMRKLGR